MCLRGRQCEITLTLVFSSGAFWMIHECTPLFGMPVEDLDPAKYIERSQVLAYSSSAYRLATETPCSETASEANSSEGNSSEGTSSTMSPKSDSNSGSTMTSVPADGSTRRSGLESAAYVDQTEHSLFESIELETIAELDRYFGG